MSNVKNHTLDNIEFELVSLTIQACSSYATIWIETNQPPMQMKQRQ